jgi:hypothetical protein
VTSPRRLALTIAAGAVLGVILTLSPLLPIVAALALALVALAPRGLPGDERKVITVILASAIVARLFVVIGVVAWSLPTTSAQSGGVLIGDEAYLFERSLRTRDVVLGYPVAKQDYMMMFEEYADTKYTWCLAWAQTMFGPSPFTLRVLNGLLFVAAAAIMHRLARRGFGPTAASWGLAVLLFLPSLLLSSVSLLKDSAFFLFTAGAFAAIVLALRHTSRAAQAGGVGLFLLMLWLLADLRPAAVILTGGGIAFGVLLRHAVASRRTMALSAVTLALVLGGILMSRDVSRPVLEALTLLSRQHMGHATTPGHAYHTLDERFYPDYAGALAGNSLNLGEGFRFVARSIAAFVAVPLPWQVRSRTELAFLPEQAAWYVIAVLALIGLPSAYRRDPLLTSVLVGYIVAMSLAIALTNGNVGTLVRLRGLVTRFVVWIAAVGLLVLLAKRHERWSAR